MIYPSIYQSIKKKNNSADESVIETDADMNDRYKRNAFIMRPEFQGAFVYLFFSANVLLYR